MSKRSFTPPLPHIAPPTDKSFQEQNELSPDEKTRLKKSIKTARKEFKDRSKKIKTDQRIDWWWTKGLIIINTILALIAAVTGIIALFR